MGKITYVSNEACCITCQFSVAICYSDLLDMGQN